MLHVYAYTDEPQTVIAYEITRYEKASFMHLQSLMLEY